MSKNDDVQAAAKVTAAKAAAAAEAKNRAVAEAAKKANQDERRKQAEAKAVQVQAANVKFLAGKAKTINSVIGRYEATVVKLDDYRATMAVHLAEAETVCRESRIAFRDWAEANIKKKDGSGPYSYSELRRLTTLGHKAGGDMEQAQKLLADMRADTAKRVKEHADRKKEAEEKAEERAEKAEEKAEERAEKAGHNGGPPLEIPGHATPESIVKLIQGLSTRSQMDVLRALGEAFGLTIVHDGTQRQLWPVVSDE